MPQINFKSNEDDFKEMQEAYNELYQTKYPQVLYMSHIDLWKITSLHDPERWKAFLLDPRFTEWYDAEDQILTRSKAMELMQKSSESRSQAEATAMNQLNAKLKGFKEEKTDETKIIYAFVPLSEIEENNPNVKILDNIPDEIKDAIQVVKT